jgi:hypothetical protein
MNKVFKSLQTEGFKHGAICRAFTLPVHNGNAGTVN